MSNSVTTRTTVGREPAEFVLPQADDPAGPHFLKDETEGSGRVPLASTVVETGDRNHFIYRELFGVATAKGDKGGDDDL